jgi:hypothetical protein
LNVNGNDVVTPLPLNGPALRVVAGAVMPALSAGVPPPRARCSGAF